MSRKGQAVGTPIELPFHLIKCPIQNLQRDELSSTLITQQGLNVLIFVLKEHTRL